MKIDKQNGFLVLPPNPASLKLVDLYKNSEPHRWPARKKKFLRNDRSIKLDNLPSAFIELADFVGDAAVEYLGEEPTLYSADLFWSHPYNKEWASSQLYHCDWEHDHTVKVFVYIKDVGIEQGPLTCIDATNSEKIRQKLDYNNDRSSPGYKKNQSHRVSDENIYQFGDKPNIFTGVAGTTILLDTCACFHYGSRVLSGERLVAHIQFLKAGHKGANRKIKWQYKRNNP